MSYFFARIFELDFQYHPLNIFLCALLGLALFPIWLYSFVPVGIYLYGTMCNQDYDLVKKFDKHSYLNGWLTGIFWPVTIWFWKRKVKLIKVKDKRRRKQELRIERRHRLEYYFRKLEFYENPTLPPVPGDMTKAEIIEGINYDGSSIDDYIKWKQRNKYKNVLDFYEKIDYGIV